MTCDDLTSVLLWKCEVIIHCKFTKKFHILFFRWSDIICIVGLYLLLFSSQAAHVDCMANCGSYVGHVPANAYCQINTPVHVELMTCKIETIDKDAFNCLEMLQFLRLDDNKLITLPAGVFRNLNNLFQLTIESEYYRCIRCMRCHFFIFWILILLN